MAVETSRGNCFVYFICILFLSNISFKIFANAEGDDKTPPTYSKNFSQVSCHEKNVLFLKSRSCPVSYNSLVLKQTRKSRDLRKEKDGSIRGTTRPPSHPPTNPLNLFQEIGKTLTEIAEGIGNLFKGKHNTTAHKPPHADFNSTKPSPSPPQPWHFKWRDRPGREIVDEVMHGFRPGGSPEEEVAGPIIKPHWSIEPSYPTAAKIFSELMSTCTIYFVTEFNDTASPLLRNFNNLCARDGDCIQLITNEDFDQYLWAWTDFNFQKVGPLYLKWGNATTRQYLLDYVRNQMQPHHNQEKKDIDWAYYKLFGNVPKFGESCLTLVRSSELSYKAVFIKDHYLNDLLPMPFNGRISPDFIFIYSGSTCYSEEMIRNGTRTKNAPSHNNCTIFSLPRISMEETSASVILIVNEMPSISTYMYHYSGQLVNLSMLTSFSRESLRSVWKAIHRRIEFPILENPKVEKKYIDKSITEKICGGTPLVQRYLDKKRYQRRHRIWDPQEECAYQVILSKYATAPTNQSRLEKMTGAVTDEWPIQLEFQGVGIGSGGYTSRGSGKKGRFYVPVSGRFQGFQWAMYIDKDSLRSQFSPTALLKPFELGVWLNFVFVIALMLVAMKMTTRSWNHFWIFSILLEQGEIKKRFLGSMSIIILVTVWIRTTFLLRQFYTGNMFSAITSYRMPETPKNIGQLLEFPYCNLYNVFVPYLEMEELLLDNDKENLTSKLLKSTRSLSPDTLREIIGPQNRTESDKYPRIALISYSRPSKLVMTVPPEWEEVDKKPEWIHPVPFDTILLALGQRMLVKNDGKLIRTKLWIYQGKRNFFSEFFLPDLNALIESGIYSWWSRQTCKIGEMEALVKEAKSGQREISWNFHEAACRELAEMKKPQLTYVPANARMIGVVWIVLGIGLGISMLGYLKEVIRFDIPGSGRSKICRWLGCNVENYKYYGRDV